MSWQALDWVRKQRVGNPHAKHILVMLANYADENASCYPSRAHLADICEISEKSVSNCLRRLEDGGYIRRARDKNEDGTFGRNRFHLCLDRPPGERASPGDQGNMTAAPGEPEGVHQGNVLPPYTSENPSEENPERESARARDSGRGDADTANPEFAEGDPRTAAGAASGDDGRGTAPAADAAAAADKALRRRCRALFMRWPGNVADVFEKGLAAWGDLDEGERERAEKRLDAFLAALKSSGSRRRVPFHEYLAERKFELVDSTAAAPAGPDDHVLVEPFGRDFWILWHRRAGQDGGARKASFMSDMARRGTSIGVRRSEMPDEASRQRYWRIDVAGAEWRAWADHYAARRIFLPRPATASFAWMPAQWPPDQEARQGAIAVEIEGVI